LLRLEFFLESGEFLTKLRLLLEQRRLALGLQVFAFQLLLDALERFLHELDLRAHDLHELAQLLAAELLARKQLGLGLQKLGLLFQRA